MNDPVLKGWAEGAVKLLIWRACLQIAEQQRFQARHFDSLALSLKR